MVVLTTAVQMAPICIAMKTTVVAYYEHDARYVAKQAPHPSLENK